MGICVEHGLGWEFVGVQTRPGQRLDFIVTLPRRGGPQMLLDHRELWGEPPNCGLFKRR
jgi:hypothetical protein